MSHQRWGFRSAQRPFLMAGRPLPTFSFFLCYSFFWFYALDIKYTFGTSGVKPPYVRSGGTIMKRLTDSYGSLTVQAPHNGFWNQRRCCTRY